MNYPAYGYEIIGTSGTAVVAVPGGSPAPATILKPGDTISQSQATSWLYLVPFSDPATSLPISTFTGNEPLRAFVWDGLSGPMLARPSIAWQSAAHGTALLSIGPADLAPLACQPYAVRVEVWSGSAWQDAFDGWLDVFPEAGTSAPTPVYASYSDLISFAGSAIRQLLTGDEGAGFALARGRARKYLDQCILAKYRPVSWQGYGSYGYGLLGYITAIDSPNVQIKSYLDSNRLIVTDQVTEIASRLAAADIFGRQEDARWASLASIHRSMAYSQISSLVAQLDVNGDGIADIAINLGVSSMRGAY